MFIDRGNSMRLTPSGVICYRTRGHCTPDGVRRARGSLGYNIALPRSAALGVALFLYKTALRSMLREVLFLIASDLNIAYGQCLIVDARLVQHPLLKKCFCAVVQARSQQYCCGRGNYRPGCADRADQATIKVDLH